MQKAVILLTLLAVSSARMILSNEELPKAHPAWVEEHQKINNLSPTEVHDQCLVKDLFGDIKSYSGFVEINEKTGSSMYFLLMEASKADPKEAPLLLWLQGGPGCSGWTGNLAEFGPYQLVKDSNGNIEMIPRDITWNDKYNLLFVDSPFGAGFSYAAVEEDYVTNELEMSQNLYKTLQVFFQKFPEFQENDFLITGESYAGHYIPNIASYILSRNEESYYMTISNTFKINLKGIAIGDGATAMNYQSQYYAEFGYANGLIDYKQYLEVLEDQKNVTEAFKRGDMAGVDLAWNASLGKVIDSAGGINMYNFRVFGPYPDLNTSFLNRDDIKAKLNIPSFLRYYDCGGEAYSKLADDIPVSYSHLFPFILERIPVLLYNGQNDLICNTPGSEAWIRNIDWPHKDDYNNAERTFWKNEDGEIAGYTRVVENLVQTVVIDAGHMVPKDQPKNAHELIDNFYAFVQKQSKKQ